MKDNAKPQLPEILNAQTVAQSRLFKVEAIDLRFSNGELRTYERMKGSGRGAVLIVALKNHDEFYLVREYCAGTHNYQLGFPKGLIDPGETALQAANRELQEEIGFAARKLTELTQVSLAPGYFSATMHIVLAEDLYPQQLPGDEPEPLQVLLHRFSEWQTLVNQPDFTEARSIAALMLVREYLQGAWHNGL